MKKFILLSLLIFHFGCANQSNTPTPTANKDVPMSSISSLKAAQQWVVQFNENPFQLSELYLAKALLLNEKGEIQNDLKSHLSIVGTSKISNLNTIKKVKATDEISYEIASFETAEKTTYKYLVVWNSIDGKDLREVELIVKANQIPLDEEGIEKARQKWMQLCNAHNATQLIKEMYTTKAVYYNHQPPVIGTAAISEVYAYMNNPNYQLSLTPIITEPVNENLAFEIGQCAGSYGGKYVIIWQKDGNGQWKVLMDTNV